jgi:hypothetical protein
MLFIAGIFPTIVFAEDNSPFKGKNISHDDSIIIYDGINKLEVYTYEMGGFFEFQIGIQFRVWINHTNVISLVNMNSSDYVDVYAFFSDIFPEKRNFSTHNIAEAIVRNYQYNMEIIGGYDTGYGDIIWIHRPLIKKSLPPYYPYLWSCNPQSSTRSFLVY